MAAPARVIRILRIVLMVTIVIYVLLGEGMIRSHEQPTNRNVYFAFTAVAIAMVLLCFAIRRFMIARAESRLASDPENVEALHRWNGGFIVTYAFSEAIALLGFVLRVLGFTLAQAAPFYVVGFFLLIFFRARARVSEASALNVATR